MSTVTLFLMGNVGLMKKSHLDNLKKQKKSPFLHFL